MQLIEGEEYVDINEAVALLGVKKATIYTYVSRGVLQSYRQPVGRRRLYRRADIDALCTIQPDTKLERQPDASTSPTPPNDGVFRNVHLPDVASWAGDH